MRVLALDIGGTWLRADVDGTTVQRQTPGNGRDALAATIELVGDAAVDAVGVGPQPRAADVEREDAHFNIRSRTCA
jgi:predicted NBD/HSP70 family sugar kinase